MEDSEPWTETIIMESDTNSISETFNGTGIPTDQIEVVFVDQPNSSCASMNLSDKSFGTKPGDLGKVLNPCLQKNIKQTYNNSIPTNESARKTPNFFRRRPSVIRPLQSRRSKFSPCVVNQKLPTCRRLPLLLSHIEKFTFEEV
ncbi:hypothetical protein RN001_003707 [Aquatica leii]|uniref:Uncharacterized protein n=1 Tax=Aquatica leii TaxID=1421715 RepID=A0AAN7PRF8_9COLE|nr:hypothetical protein RN001_003707 [Aquatica leii]